MTLPPILPDVSRMKRILGCEPSIGSTSPRNNSVSSAVTGPALNSGTASAATKFKMAVRFMVLTSLWLRLRACTETRTATLVVLLGFGGRCCRRSRRSGDRAHDDASDFIGARAEENINGGVIVLFQQLTEFRIGDGTLFFEKNCLRAGLHSGRRTIRAGFHIHRAPLFGWQLYVGSADLVGILYQFHEPGRLGRGPDGQRQRKYEQEKRGFHDCLPSLRRISVAATVWPDDVETLVVYGIRIALRLTGAANLEVVCREAATTDALAETETGPRRWRRLEFETGFTDECGLIWKDRKGRCHGALCCEIATGQCPVDAGFGGLERIFRILVIGGHRPLE